LRQLETEGDREVVIAELKNRKKRMSYRELSQKFGVSKDTVSRIITENGQGISDEIFRKIAEKL
jgi:DNA-binding Xre family transcriptional regulator